MKKILALLLCASLCLCAMSCGNKKKTGTDASDGGSSVTSGTTGSQQDESSDASSKGNNSDSVISSKSPDVSSSVPATSDSVSSKVPAQSDVSAPEKKPATVDYPKTGDSGIDSLIKKRADEQIKSLGIDVSLSGTQVSDDESVYSFAFTNEDDNNVFFSVNVDVKSKKIITFSDKYKVDDKLVSAFRQAFSEELTTDIGTVFSTDDEIKAAFKNADKVGGKIYTTFFSSLVVLSIQADNGERLEIDFPSSEINNK